MIKVKGEIKILVYPKTVQTNFDAMKFYPLSIFFVTFAVLYVSYASTEGLSHTTDQQNVTSETDSLHSEIRTRSLQSSDNKNNRLLTENASHHHDDDHHQHQSIIDEKILLALRNVLSLIKTPECRKDFNATIAALQQRKTWAIASTFFV